MKKLLLLSLISVPQITKPVSTQQIIGGLIIAGGAAKSIYAQYKNYDINKKIAAIRAQLRNSALNSAQRTQLIHELNTVIALANKNNKATIISLATCCLGYSLLKTPTFTSAPNPAYNPMPARPNNNPNRPNNNPNGPNNDDDLNRIAADLLAAEEQRQQQPNINTINISMDEAQARAAAQSPNAFQWNPAAQQVTNAVRNIATEGTAIDAIDCPICTYNPATANQTFAQFWTLFGNCNHALCKTCKLKEINHPCPMCRGPVRR